MRKDPRLRQPPAGAAADGYYFACGCLDATTAPAAAAFNKAYTAKFSTPPSTYSPEAFDATNAMISAISAAQKAGGVTRATVETAVNALDYKGITTTVKFPSTGEVAQATVNLYEQRAARSSCWVTSPSSKSVSADAEGASARRSAAPGHPSAI